MDKEVRFNAHMDATNMADTEPDWYDFGGGYLVAPPVPDHEPKGEHMAALQCVRNGKFYFYTVEFDTDEKNFTETLRGMKAELMPKFLADVERMTQETTHEG